MFGGENLSEILSVALGVKNQNLTNQLVDFYKPNIFVAWLAVQVPVESLFSTNEQCFLCY